MQLFCQCLFLGLFMFSCSSNFCCSHCHICLYYLLGDNCSKCQLCLFSLVSHELWLVVGPVLSSDLSMLFLRLIIFLKNFSSYCVLILWVHLRWLGKGRLPLWTLQVAIVLMVMNSWWWWVVFASWFSWSWWKWWLQLWWSCWFRCKYFFSIL